MISRGVVRGINSRLIPQLVISDLFPQSIGSLVQDFCRTGFGEEENRDNQAKSAHPCVNSKKHRRNQALLALYMTMAPWDPNMPLGSGLMTPTGVYLVVAFVAVGLYALYQWLLPKPLPGIAYNPETTKSLFGDAPDMIREISVTGEFGFWMAKQVEKMSSPMCQIFVRPFSKPWVLVADFRESQDILMRRTEFDKPTFISDGLEALGDFHAKYKTNSAFRACRQLKQDLMTPSFLNNFMGPFMHSKGLGLVKLLETKMNLAKGRPFSVLADFDYAALDVMLNYAFGANMVDSALGPQVNLITQLDSSVIPDGDLDEPVAFPKAPISPFLEAVQHAPEVLEKTTISWIPRLSLWWWKQQSWYKKIFSQKSRCVPPQITKALENYHAGEVKSALEHILRREQVTAEKQGREPQFDSQSMVDEVRPDPRYTPATLAGRTADQRHVCH